MRVLEGPKCVIKLVGDLCLSFSDLVKVEGRFGEDSTNIISEQEVLPGDITKIRHVWLGEPLLKFIYFSMKRLGAAVGRFVRSARSARIVGHAQAGGSLNSAATEAAWVPQWSPGACRRFSTAGEPRFGLRNF